MDRYKAPLQDYAFLLNDVFPVKDLLALDAFRHLDADLIATVIAEAAKICEGALLPIRASGDREGSRFSGGRVTLPSGFREAYKLFAEGGWIGLTGDLDWGGQGFPLAVGSVVEEMVCAANPGFAMSRGLVEGACRAIGAHASQDLKEIYLPRLLAGEWLPTMCLTEPQCGSDLSLRRTKAVPVGDGSYRVTGTKIFVSGGDQDLSDNIVHLVLARLPDAPPGTAGISLFIVPKMLPGDDGAFGQANHVVCSGIEHKMGLRASPTCVMNFEDATGWLVGPPHAGLRSMFTMMNAARLGVAVKAIGIGEAAFQKARAYAAERRQGRAPGALADRDNPADLIERHPDVRRMLLTQQALVEGGRALAIWVARSIDLSRASPDPDARQTADDIAQLLTPVTKAFLTDAGFEVASLGMQIHGGYGYIADWGVEQMLRDVRVTMIYEGTNGIQAQDLVGRKLRSHGGRLPSMFFDEISGFIDAVETNPTLAATAAKIAEALAGLRETTEALRASITVSPENIAAISTDYLKQFGYVTLGYLWLRMAAAAIDPKSGDAVFRARKLAAAKFYVTRLLPLAAGFQKSVLAGLAETMSAEP